MPEIISRKEARARGITIFLSKKPCKRGHYERYASNGCVQCIKDNLAVRRLEPDFRAKEAERSRKRKRQRKSVESKRKDNRRQSMRRTAAMRALRELGIVIDV